MSPTSQQPGFEPDSAPDPSAAPGSAGQVHGEARHARLHLVLGSCCCLVLAVSVWLVFHPGILTPDSLDQYAQARSGRFNNWFPPVMSLVLSGVMKLGGDIGLVTLLQSCAGVLGLWLLVRNLLPMVRPQLSPAVRTWASVAAVVVLSIPVPPLMFYLVTFWKDAWVMVAFLYAGALGAWLCRNVAARPRSYWAVFALFVASMVLAVLARHNALAVLPGFVAITASTLFARRVRFALLWALLAGGVMAAAPKSLEKVASVRDGRPFLQVVALDLIGMCVLDPSIQDELTYTRRFLSADYGARYRFGEVAPILFEPPLIVKAGYFADPDALIDEYRAAILDHPRQFLRVKWRAFLPLLGFLETHAWFEADIYSNQMGLEQNPVFAPVRSALTRRAEGWRESPSWRWVSSVHGLWLLVSLLVLLPWAVFRRHATGQEAIFMVALVSYPVLYYASYLIAAPTPAFRFMYPSTLMAQAVVAALLVSFAGAARRRVSQWSSRTPRA